MNTIQGSLGIRQLCFRFEDGEGMSLTNSADSYNISGAYPAPDLIQTRLVSIYLLPYLSTYPSIFIYLDMITIIQVPLGRYLSMW